MEHRKRDTRLILIFFLRFALFIKKASSISIGDAEGNLCVTSGFEICRCSIPEYGIMSFSPTKGGYYESIGDSQYSISKDSLSLSAWINLNADETGNNNILMAAYKNAGGTVSAQASMILTSGIGIECIFENIQNDNSLFTSSIYGEDSTLSFHKKWHFIACTYKRGFSSLHINKDYINQILDFPKSSDLQEILFEKIVIGQTSAAGYQIFNGRIAEICIFQKAMSEEIIYKLKLTPSSQISSDSELLSYLPIYIISGSPSDSSGNVYSTYKATTKELAPTGTIEILKSYSNGYPLCEGDGINSSYFSLEEISELSFNWFNLVSSFEKCFSVSNLGFPFHNVECISQLESLYTNNFTIFLSCCQRISVINDFDDLWDEQEYLMCIQLQQLRLISNCDENQLNLNSEVEECYSFYDQHSCQDFSRSNCQWVGKCLNHHASIQSIEDARLLYSKNAECSQYDQDQVQCTSTLTTTGIKCQSHSFCAPLECRSFTDESSCNSADLGCFWVSTETLDNPSSDNQCKAKDCNLYQTIIECNGHSFCIWGGEGNCQRKSTQCYSFLESCSSSSYCQINQYCLPDCSELSSSKNSCEETDGCVYIGCAPSKNECDSITSWQACLRPAFPFCYLDGSSCKASSELSGNAPIMNSAKFYNQGHKLRINFNINTNFGNWNEHQSQSCSQYFSASILSKFGSGYRCVWVDPQNLDIWMGSSATLGIETLTIINNVIADEKSSNYISDPGDISIQTELDESISLPTVIIRHYGSVRSCDSILLDASQSISLGSRKLKFQWTFTSTDSAFNSKYSTDNSEDNSKIRISSSDLINGNTYSFDLTITDAFGQSVTESSIFYVQDTLSYYIYSTRGIAITINPEEDSFIPFFVAIPTCGIVPDTISYSISWRLISLTDGGSFSIGRCHQYQDSLEIPANVLPGGAVLTLQVRVIDDNGIYAASQIVITSQSQPIHCILSGGNRQAGVNEDLTLYGDRSYDPYDSTGANLIYAWTCLELSPGLIQTPCHSSIILEPLLSTYPSTQIEAIVISAGLLEQDKTYKFMLELQDSTDSSRTTTCSTVVETIGLNSIYVSFPSMNPIVKVSNSNSSISAGIANFGEDLLSEFESIEWKIIGEQSEDGSFIQKNFPLVSLTPNSLKEGVDYIFQVLVQTTYEFSGSSQIEFQINIPPRNGEFLFSQTTGTELNTSFKVDATLWEDEDFPLTYQYFIVGKKIIDSSSYRIPITGRFPRSSYVFKLPKISDSNQLTLVCVVYDNLGDSTENTRILSINPMDDDTFVDFMENSFLHNALNLTSIFLEVLGVSERLFAFRELDFPSTLSLSSDEIEEIEKNRILVERMFEALTDAYDNEPHTIENFHLFTSGLFFISKDSLNLFGDLELAMLQYLEGSLSDLNEDMYLSEECVESLLFIMSSILGSIESDIITPSELPLRAQITQLMEDCLDLIREKYLMGQLPHSHPLQVTTPNIAAIYIRTTPLHVESQTYTLELPNYSNSEASHNAEFSFPEDMLLSENEDRRMIVDFEGYLFRTNPFYLNHINTTEDTKGMILRLQFLNVGVFSEIDGSFQYRNTPLKLVNDLTEGIDMIIPKHSQFTHKQKFFNHECMYLDQSNNKWELEGCILYETDELISHCKCNHLSVFGFNFSNPTTTWIKFKEGGLNYEEPNYFNYTSFLESQLNLQTSDVMGLIFILAMLSLYMIIGIFCLRRDKHTLPEKSIVIKKAKRKTSKIEPIRTESCIPSTVPPPKVPSSLYNKYAAQSTRNIHKSLHLNLTALKNKPNIAPPTILLQKMKSIPRTSTISARRINSTIDCVSPASSPLKSPFSPKDSKIMRRIGRQNLPVKSFSFGNNQLNLRNADPYSKPTSPMSPTSPINTKYTIRTKTLKSQFNQNGNNNHPKKSTLQLQPQNIIDEHNSSIGSARDANQISIMFHSPETSMQRASDLPFPVINEMDEMNIIPSTHRGPRDTNNRRVKPSFDSIPTHDPFGIPSETEKELMAHLRKPPPLPPPVLNVPDTEPDQYETNHKCPSLLRLFLVKCDYINILKEEHKITGIYFKTDDQYYRISRLTILFTILYTEFFLAGILMVLEIGKLLNFLMGSLIAIVLIFPVFFFSLLYKRQNIFYFHNYASSIKIISTNTKKLRIAIVLNSIYMAFIFNGIVYLSLNPAFSSQNKIDRYQEWIYLGFYIMAIEIFLIETIEAIIKAFALRKRWIHKFYKNKSFNWFNRFFTGLEIVETVTGERILYA